MGGEAEHDPARTARQRLRGGNKLAPPLVDAAEVLFERGNHHRGGDLPAAAKVGKVQLVEDG